MPDLKIIHQSVRDYIAAKKRGDRVTCDRIIAEVQSRYATQSTDGSELVELGRAMERVRFGEDL